VAKSSKFESGLLTEASNTAGMFSKSELTTGATECQARAGIVAGTTRMSNSNLTSLLLLAVLADLRKSVVCAVSGRSFPFRSFAMPLAGDAVVLGRCVLNQSAADGLSCTSMCDGLQQRLGIVGLV
jgi:hypothetical protein